ncbi:MAG: PAC2 family protein [Acidimicrobiia bacterium]|nr:PAC2 family protein [Acidimicrobiia bacterium]
MDAIHRFAKPLLRRPRAIIAFEGWGDACEAASGAANYLIGVLDAGEPFAVIDPEEFFDFQAHRPTVSIGDGETRRLSWPTTRFHAVSLPEDDRDLIIVTGDEPSYRWKTFGRHVTQVLCDNDVEDVILLGAFIGQVAHTQQVPVIGVATDPALVIRNGLLTSEYEGPTGIVGVVVEACREAGIPALALWAATPHYLAANPNPKAMLALATRATSILQVAADYAELETVTDEYMGRVNAALEASEEFSEYVTKLEQIEPTPDSLESGAAEGLVTEIEDYLRYNQ